MRRLLALGLLALTTGCVQRQRPASLTVSVAASLQPAMEDIAEKFAGAHLDYNFGASGALAGQIAAGAPVDVFLSAGTNPMDDLQEHARIFTDTRRDLLRNEIVLVAPDAAASLTSFEGLAGPEVKRVALGDPDSVPAGDYGRQSLISMHLWEQVQPKLVLAKDVRQVLTYVESGNADAGIVYATDAKTSAHVRVVAMAPPQTHRAILYPVAVVRTTHDEKSARAFVNFLTGPEARAIFEARGFTPAAP